MHLFSISSILLFRLIPSLTTASSLVARSDIDGPCTGDSGNPGVCVKNTKCTAAGGTYIDNACPNTPNDIKCCIKPSCGTGGKGNCRFTTSCSTGITETNKCPGPVGFKCCMPKGSGGDGGSDPPPSGGGGGRGNPDIPTTGSGCKQVAIDGAKKIVAQFPGKINPVYCIRQCSDPSSSDHCTGKATDLMVADGGSKVAAGEPIAEWVMKNRESLSLSYVMWGQRIWNAGRDSEKPWNEWRYQACTVIPNCVNGDRGDNTQNHWDHVHVSYQ